jgi:polyisoprenoid-binding protein YceI
MLRLKLIVCLLLLPVLLRAQAIYEAKAGTISFHSYAPKELIFASSSQLEGLVDVQKKVFAFRISISSFKGFNSPLQREHFNENYMESAAYPQASFSGKIIEDVDFTKDGTYEVRAKGKLMIHGVAQERTIKSRIVTKDGIITITSDFSVLLIDHNIKIPRVVYEKLAPEISVSVSAQLNRRK